MKAPIRHNLINEKSVIIIIGEQGKADGHIQYCQRPPSNDLMMIVMMTEILILCDKKSRLSQKTP